MAEYCISIKTLTGFDSIKNIIKLPRYKRTMHPSAWCHVTSQSRKLNLCITMRPHVPLKLTCLCLRFPSLCCYICSCISNPVPIVSNTCLASGIDTSKMTCVIFMPTGTWVWDVRGTIKMLQPCKKDKNWWPFAEFKMHFLNTSAPMGFTSWFAMIPKSLSYFDVRV